MNEDNNRPYPNGVCWDEAWRQRKRADALKAENERLVKKTARLRTALEKVHHITNSDGWKDEIIAKCSNIARKALEGENE